MPDILQGHEDRIQRIEDAIMGSSKTLAEHGVTLENIAQSVEESKERIESKIDSGFEEMKQEMHQTNEQVKQLAKIVGENTVRIKNIEEAEATRKKRWDDVKRVGVWIVVAVGGVFVKELAAYAMLMLR